MILAAAFDLITSVHIVSIKGRSRGVIRYALNNGTELLRMRNDASA